MPSKRRRSSSLRTSAGPGPPRDTGLRPHPPGSAFVALAALTGSTVPGASRAVPDPKDGPPCHLCTARCCKYFALEIDAPITQEDHDYVRWYLMHEHVVVWRQDGDWYLEVRTPCANLSSDGRCVIYDTRPKICREYGLPDADNPEAPCEFFTDDVDYDLFFDSAESFESWSRAELEKRARRLERRRRLYRDRKLGSRSREAIA